MTLRRFVASARCVRPTGFLLVVVLGLPLVACRRAPAVPLVDRAVPVDITTGWFDAGIVEGPKNKLVPTIAIRLENRSTELLRLVQLNAVFRRVEEEEQWGSAFVRAVGGEGLSPGDRTPAIVMRSDLGYTSEVPRSQMLQHSQFRDVRVELFAKEGSSQWTKLGEFTIERQLLTQ